MLNVSRCLVYSSSRKTCRPKGPIASSCAKPALQKDKFVWEDAWGCMGRVLSHIYSSYMYVFIIKVTHKLLRCGDAHKKAIKEKQEKKNQPQSHLPESTAVNISAHSLQPLSFHVVEITLSLCALLCVYSCTYICTCYLSQEGFLLIGYLKSPDSCLLATTQQGGELEGKRKSVSEIKNMPH